MLPRGKKQCLLSRAYLAYMRYNLKQRFYTQSSKTSRLPVPLCLDRSFLPHSSTFCCHPKTWQKQYIIKFKGVFTWLLKENKKYLYSMQHNRLKILTLLCHPIISKTLSHIFLHFAGKCVSSDWFTGLSDQSGCFQLLMILTTLN